MCGFREDMDGESSATPKSSAGSDAHFDEEGGAGIEVAAL
jgi:hypothetical protein